MAASLRVRILGPLEVEGCHPSKLGSRKQRTLLRALGLGRGGAVSVDQLVGCLWPARLPARPADEVGVLISRLRSVLGAERIKRSDAGYALLADWIDLAALEQLAAEAEGRLSGAQPAAAATAAKAGLALVRGPLLADEPDATWAHEARVLVDRTLARLRLVAAEASLATGDPFGAAPAAQSALDNDPYDELALRLLMTAHARAGRPASALAVYAKTRQALAEDLGSSPSQLTEALHLAILKEEIAPEAAPLSHSSPPSPPARPGYREPALPGRSVEWRRLDDALAQADEKTELVIIEGEAGMGKTSLLETWAASLGTERVVLWGSCDPLASALPLQPVLDALDRHLARVGEAEGDELRAMAGPVLGPLLRGGNGAPQVRDPLTAQATLFAGALRFCCGSAQSGAPVLVLDDVHLADATTLAWLSFAARRPSAGPLLVVLACRPEKALVIPGATRLSLGPLDLAATIAIVGEERAPALLERSGGNPLFLVELANFEGDELPASVLEAVAARCAQAGDAEQTLRTAAILGREVDLDLLSAVLQRSAVALLRHLEEGHRLMILEERGTVFAYRHDLVREALVAGTNATRRAWAHREAARLLAARSHHDPLSVAMHARQGGDLERAATALVEAAAVASARFDHAEAERLLDDSLGLSPQASAFVARARTRLTAENFVGAFADAAQARALGAGAEALELAGWAAYYQRDFAKARHFCEQAQSVLIPGDNALKLSVLALAGRISHADGDLHMAQESLESAVAAAPSAERAGVAAVWLGWLRADRGDSAGADRLAATAGGDPSLGAHPFAEAHRALLAAYSSALQGRIGQAMSFLEVVDREVEARHLEHFAGRSANYRAWLLRNLLFGSEADDLNVQAAEIAKGRGLREAQAQSGLDLADGCLRRSQLAEAASWMELAESLGSGYAFAWKARLRAQLLGARLALADGRPADAEAGAVAVAEEASRLEAPRYLTLARVIKARAWRAGGRRIDTRTVGRLITEIDRFAIPEAWWAIGELAGEFGVDRWWALAGERVRQIAAEAGARGEDFSRNAGILLDKMRSSRGAG